MTQEGQGIRPDETPTPPVSTRWTEQLEPDTQPDEVLSPPYVPGRSRAAPDEAPVQDTDDAVLDVHDVSEEPAEATDDVVDTDAAGMSGEEPLSLPIPPDQEGQGEDDGWLTELAEDEPEPTEPETDEEFAVELLGFEGADIDHDAQDRDLIEDVATRLETLADRVRQDGYGALEAEMASLDRLSALLAGVLAGYMTGIRQ